MRTPPQSVSNYTMWVATRVLEDRAFVRSYVASVQDRLERCFMGLEDALAAVGVPLTPCHVAAPPPPPVGLCGWVWVGGWVGVGG